MKANWDNFWKSQGQRNGEQISWSKARMMDILSDYICGKDAVLDAGCGSGFFSKYFAGHGLTTFSLDYSKEALEITKVTTAGKTALIQTDLLNDHLPKVLGRKFDIVFSDGLFEHFNFIQQNQIMHNLLLVLKPSGLIVTFVPNRWSPWQIIRPFMMPGIEERPMTVKQLTCLNVQNDLEVIAAGGINTFPFRFSPEGKCAELFGMLVYTISRRK